MRHIVLTGVLGCLILFLGCDPEPGDLVPDAGDMRDGGDDALDAGRLDDGHVPDPADGGAPCDCCGTSVGVSGGDGCGGGVCDNWCGHVIPCDDSCERTTHVCVVTFGGADAGAPPDGGPATPAFTSECVPRPSACDDAANCGGPAPDPSCDVSDPCFEALDCAPNRVIHSGFLVECRGA